MKGHYHLAIIIFQSFCFHPSCARTEDGYYTGRFVVQVDDGIKTASSCAKSIVMRVSGQVSRDYGLIVIKSILPLNISCKSISFTQWTMVEILVNVCVLSPATIPFLFSEGFTSISDLSMGLINYISTIIIVLCRQLRMWLFI